jgi:hypothetical protein
MADSPYLTQAEAAEYVRVCLATFKKNVRPAIRCCRVGRKPLFLRADLDVYMTEHTYSTANRSRRGKGSGNAAFAANTKAAQVLEELG